MGEGAHAGEQAGGVSGSAADAIIDQIATAATGYVATTAKLAKQLVGLSTADPQEGPLQELWMTWAGGVGDLVTMWYGSAQLLDTLGGFGARAQSGPAATDPEAGTAGAGA